MSSQAQTYSTAQQSFAAGNYDDALTAAKQAIEKSGEDTRLLLLAGDIHSAMAAQDSFQSEDVREAARYYKHVVRLTNENSEAHLDARIAQEQLWQDIMSLTAKNEEQGRYSRALQLLDVAKLVLPTNEKSYLLAGKLAFGLKHYEVAEENFNYLIDSLDYDGNQIQELLNSLLAVSLMKDGIGETSGVLANARQLDGNSIDANTMKLEILIDKGKMDYAEKWMDSIKLNDQERAQYYLKMGQKFQSDGSPQKAIEYYQKTLSADETVVDARYLLAIVYQKMASKILDEENVADAPKKKALSYLESARNQLQKLAKKQPNYPLVNYTLNTVKATLERLS